MARDRGRLDPYELAVLRGGDDQSLDGVEDDGDGRPPPLPKLRLGNLRVGSLGLLGFFAVLILGALVTGGGQAGERPELPTSCTTPALALSVAEAEQGTPVTFAATGPAEGGDVVLAIGAASLGADLSAVPASPGGATQVVLPAVPLAECKAEGELGVVVPPGDYPVTLFRLTPAGAVKLVEQRLVVTPEQ